MAKIEKCPHCGKKIKENKQHTECYGCKCTERFIAQGPAAPSTKVEKAINHLNENQNLLKQIFNPIKVQKTKDGWKVKNGRHRVAAYKLLGYTKIPARFSTKTKQNETDITEHIHRPSERGMFNHFGLQPEQSNSSVFEPSCQF